MSSFKKTSKIQIIDPSPFLNKHINAANLNAEEDVSNQQRNSKKINFDNQIETNSSTIQNNRAEIGLKQKFQFLNFSSQKKYLIERYSKLTVKKKVRLFIVLGVLCSFLVILFILLILFATGKRNIFFLSFI